PMAAVLTDSAETEAIICAVPPPGIQPCCPVAEATSPAPGVARSSIVSARTLSAQSCRIDRSNSPVPVICYPPSCKLSSLQSGQAQPLEQALPHLAVQHLGQSLRLAVSGKARVKAQDLLRHCFGLVL